MYIRAFSDLVISAWRMWIGVPLEYWCHLCDRWLEILKISDLRDGYESCMKAEMALWAIDRQVAAGTVGTGELT